MQTQLIIVAGLKSSGKTTLAEAIARRERVAYFAVDRLRKELLPPSLRAVYLGKDELHTLALNLLADQLRLGVSAVIEGEFVTHDIRQRLSDLAQSHGAAFCPIYLTVGDDMVWQHRIIANIKQAAQDATFTGWQELSTMRRLYEPWPTSTLLLDTALPQDDNYDRVQAYLRNIHHPYYRLTD